MNRTKYLLLAGATLALMVLLHLWAGRTLPAPVGDEVAFFYPAQAFSLHGTLATNHLTSGRPLHWMPPAYPVTLGVWFKAVGSGYAQAHWLSFGFAACAFCLLFRLGKRLGLSASGLALICFAFCSRHAVVMGNFIRMEGMLLTLLLLAAWLLWRGRRVAALALILLSLLVHPNGLYWLAGFPFLAWLASKGQPQRPIQTRWETYALLGSMALLTTYAAYVLTVWVDFWHDWQHQFKTRNLSEGFSELLFRPDQLAFGLLSMATLYGVERMRHSSASHLSQQSRERRAGLHYLLGISLLFWLMRILGQGWGYGVFNILAVALVAGVLLTLLPTLHPLLARRFSQVAAMGVVAVGLVVGKVFSIPFIPAHYLWHSMRPEQALPGTGSEPYLTQADRAAVQLRLGSLRRQLGRAPRLYTVPEGDGIYYLGTPSGGQVALHTLSVFGEWLPEYVLLHYWPGDTFFESNQAEVVAVCPGGKLPAPFYERGGHRYYLIDLQGRVPAFLIPEERR